MLRSDEEILLLRIRKESLVEPLALAPEARTQLEERWVYLLVYLETEVVAVVLRRLARKVRLARGRVRVGLAFLDHQPEAHQRGHQSQKVVRPDADRLRKAGEILWTARQPGEDVEIERGEQGLGRHEAIPDARDLAYVGNGGHQAAPTTSCERPRRCPLRRYCQIGADGSNRRRAGYNLPSNIACATPSKASRSFRPRRKVAR